MRNLDHEVIPTDHTIKRISTRGANHLTSPWTGGFCYTNKRYIINNNS